MPPSFANRDSGFVSGRRNFPETLSGPDFQIGPCPDQLIVGILRGLVPAGETAARFHRLEFSMARWQFTGVFLVAVAATGHSHAVAAEEPAKAATKAPPAEAADEDAPDPYHAPDGIDPKSLQRFLKELAAARPAKRGAAGMKD